MLNAIAIMNMNSEEKYIVCASSLFLLCGCKFCVIVVSSMLSGNGFVIGVVSLGWGVDVLG